jgi:CMP-N-acetylneuraminic acid synthetase
MTIACIIARGGSKRLPRKNVKPFCGHPLVAWAITQARCSHLVDKVYLSTDDDEIETIGRKYGAEIIRRPDWPDADQASGTRPMAHMVELLVAKYGPEFDTHVSMLPTKPLVLPNQIDTAIMAYRTYGFDNIAYLCPERQVVVFKKLSEHRVRNVIFNKTYGYLIDGLGFNVTSPGWYLNFFVKAQVEKAGDDTDKTIDKVCADGAGEAYYLQSESWQHADVDTAPEFEFAELVMDHYILKGRGMAVYEEYAAQKNKAGNWRQQ